MPGTLKLLKTLRRQGPVLAFMVLATSALETDAKESIFTPEAAITVPFDSSLKDSRRGYKATISLKAPELKGDDPKVVKARNSIRFSLLGTGGGTHCGGSTKFINREVVVKNQGDPAHNRNIEFGYTINKETYHTWGYNNKGEFTFKVTLCGAIIGSQFKILWSSTEVSPPFGDSSTTIVHVVSDDTPTVSITGGSAVTEGGKAEFTVSAAQKVASDLTVQLTVTDAAGSDFIAPGDEGNKSVVIAKGKRSVTYEVQTQGDTTDEPSADISVAVASNAAYKLGSPSSATVRVNDDDTAPANNAPTISNAIPDQTATTGAAFNYTFPANTFSDADNDNLTYTATKSDGNALPSWLTFNANTRTFSGTPQSANVGTFSVKVTADDGNDGAVSDTFDIMVSNTGTTTPTITIAGGSAVTEGTAASFTLTASPTPSADLNVSVNVTQNGNFVASSGQGTKTVTIPSGQTSKIFTVPTQDDSTDEPDGSVTSTLAGGSGYSVGSPSSASVTVNDDDLAATATLSLSGPADANEGNSGTSDKYFTVSLSKAPSRFVSWQLCFSGSATIDAPGGGTIPASADYQAISGQTPIDLSGRSPMCTSRTFKTTDSSFTNTDLGIRIKGDTDSESDETVIATLKIDDGPADVVLGTSEVTYMILDDDSGTGTDTAPTPSLVLSKNTLNVAEGGTGSYTVNLATEPTGTVTVAIASNNSDVTASPTSLTFHASGGSKPWNTAQTVTVSAGQDGDDADESATLTHTAAGGGYGSVTGSVAVTVNDDDSPPPTQPAASFASASSSAAEDGGTRSVTVNLSTGAPAGGLTLGYSVSGTATAGSGNDFTIQNSGTLSVSAGGTTATIPVAINDDSTNENDETVILTLTGGTGYTLGSPKAHTLTITDNDETASPLSSPSQPVITISGGNAVTEGTAASFTLTASPAPGTSLVVNLNVSEETGGGQDYVAASDEGGKTVTISANAGTATFTVGTISDSTDEPNGRVMVAVDTGTDYSRGSTSSASVAVNDDDATPSSSLSSPSQPVITIAGGSPVTEGTAASFTLTASPAPSANLDVSVNVTQNGDFVASDDRGTKTVTIPSGQTSKTFTVPTQGDSTDEPNGSVTSTLATGGGYLVGSTSSASVTVNDDDDPPPAQPAASFGSDRSLSIDDATAMEKDGVISFTVRLSAATVGNSQATVRVATRDVTAVSGLDYRSVDTRLVFRAGETTKVVTVGLINDAHNEGAETFEVVLSNPSNAIIGDGVATGTINNADYVPRSELAHFGRQVANQVLEGVIGRIRSPRAPGVSARIAGNAVPSGRAPGPNCTVCNTLSTDKRVEKFDREEVLTNSSFVLNGQDAPGRSPAFWGRGTRSDFTDRPGGLSLDGGVTSFMLGTDLGWNDGRLLGLALIRSSGEIDHMEWAGGGDRNTGRTELTLTALVPYAGWKINERVDAWGALGHGSGEMHLGLNAGERAEEISAGFDWTMAAGGLRGALAGFDDGPRLTAVLDGWRVKTSSKETEGLAATRSSMTRLRAGLEAGWEMQLEDGAVLAPRLETNLIRESGDTGSSFGLELVGGLSWTDPGLGLAIDMSARRLRSDESSGRKDHGYSMALVYDPDPDSGRGLSLSMRQETGNPGSTMDDFLTSSLPGGADEGGTHWTTELAYGLPAVGGSFTGSPHAGIEETDDYRDYKLGWRLTPAGPQAPDISFDINASRREQTMSSSADHRLGIGLVAEW